MAKERKRTRLPGEAQAPQGITRPADDNEQKDLNVPMYPLDPDCSETQIFPWHNRLILSWALAPREQSLGGQQRSRLWTMWEPTPDGMNRFKEAIHEWLIRKQGFRNEDLRQWSFSDLASKIIEVVREDDIAVNALWKRELQEAFETGIRYKEWWQERARDAIALVRAYVDAVTKGERPARPPMPWLHEHFRPPDAEDTPWRCLVLGLKLEGLFRSEGYLIPPDVPAAMKTLGDVLDDPIYRRVDGDSYIGAMANLDEVKSWWLCLRADLPQEDRPDNSRPNDLMLLGPVMDGFYVSRPTLLRAIKERRLRSWRIGTGPHEVSRADVKRLYRPRGL